MRRKEAEDRGVPKRLIMLISLLCVLVSVAIIPSGCASKKVEEVQETQEEHPDLVLENFLKEDGYLDVDALQVLNGECYAWIVIEGTDISFPVLQPSEDLSWYLGHDFWGKRMITAVFIRSTITAWTFRIPTPLFMEEIRIPDLACCISIRIAVTLMDTEKSRYILLTGF